jgi:hypothetical protein
MLLRSEMLPLFARAAVKRLRSDREMNVDERSAVLIEQRLEALLRSGLTTSSASEGAAGPATPVPLVERRTSVVARSRPVPSAVRIREEPLRRFLDAVAAELCRSESVPWGAPAEARVRAALRDVLPSRVDVDPDSSITRPTGWIPPGEAPGGASPASAPALLRGDRPTRAPLPDGDDGFDLD